MDVKPKATNLLVAVLGKRKVEGENKVTAQDVQSRTTNVRPPSIEVEQLPQNPSTVIEIENSKKNQKQHLHRTIHEVQVDIISDEAPDALKKLRNFFYPSSDRLTFGRRNATPNQRIENKSRNFQRMQWN